MMAGLSVSLVLSFPSEDSGRNALFDLSSEGLSSARTSKVASEQGTRPADATDYNLRCRVG